jgi:hypothetical protein
VADLAREVVVEIVEVARLFDETQIHGASVVAPGNIAAGLLDIKAQQSTVV